MSPAASHRQPAAASPVRDIAAAVRFGLLAIAGAALTTSVAVSTLTTGDYATHASVGGDNAGPALNALLHGDLAGYVTHQPAIGLTSLLLRLPFAGMASLLSGGEGLVVYRWGAVACLLPLALLAAWLITRPRPGRLGWLPGAVAAAVLLLSPAVRDAVAQGHPEDVLAGVLATMAVVAATRGHLRSGAVLLGLAVAAKPWAVIAVPPVLVAVPGQRVRAMAIAGAVAVLLAAAAPLADPAGFLRAIHGEGENHLVNAFSFWWPVSGSFHLASGALPTARLLPLGMTRSAASVIGLIVAGACLAFGWVQARQRGGACDPLALLALLGVVRLAIDPTHLEYYYLVALIPLAVWESVALGRLPLLTVAATMAVALIPWGAQHVDPAVLSAVSIVGTLALAASLADRVVPRRAARRTAPERSRLRPAAAAARVR